MNGQGRAKKHEECTFNIPFKQLSSDIFFSGFFFSYKRKKMVGSEEMLNHLLVETFLT